MVTIEQGLFLSEAHAGMAEKKGRQCVRAFCLRYPYTHSLLLMRTCSDRARIGVTRELLHVRLTNLCIEVSSHRTYFEEIIEAGWCKSDLGTDCER